MLRRLLGLKGGASGKKDAEALRLGIDPEMNYCPSCGDEYRADIETCAGCRLPLISGRERLALERRREESFHSRSMEIAPGEPLVAIRGGKLRDLKPLQLLLAKERIPSLMTGEAGDCRKG